MQRWDKNLRRLKEREYLHERFTRSTMFNRSGNLEFGFLKEATRAALDVLQIPSNPTQILVEILETNQLSRYDLRRWKTVRENIRFHSSERKIPGVNYIGGDHCLAFRPEWFDLDPLPKMWTNLHSLDLRASVEDFKDAYDRAHCLVQIIGNKGGFYKMNGRPWEFPVDGPRALRGLQRQFLLVDFMKWHWPEMVFEPESNGPCPFDFSVRLPDRTVRVDAASSLGTRFGHKRPTDLHMLLRFDDDDAPSKVFWDGTLTGQQFVDGVEISHGRSPIRTIVMWNMLFAKIPYDEFVEAAKAGYEREAKGVHPNQQKSRPPEGSVPLFDYKKEEDES